MTPSARCAVLLLAALAFAPAFVAAQPIVAGFERFHASADDGRSTAEGGLLLLNELNCVACHAAPEAWRERVPGRGRLHLAGVGARLTPQTLARYIAAPATLKPGTIMPQLGANAAEAADLAAYLAALPAAVPAASYPEGDAQRGRALFERVGCVACHAPANTTTAARSVPLDLARHADRGALAAFLQDPLRTRPAGRMPATELSAAEAADLAAYLAPAGPALTPNTAVGDAAAGRARFLALNCAACHETGEDVTVRAARPLAEARSDRGCLGATLPAGAPDFSLSVRQRDALRVALDRIRTTPAPARLTVEERVATTFTQLNCFACHEWRGRGGVEAWRAPFFAPTDTTAESLGEMGHLPPKLDVAGRKLTPAWLAKLLWGSGGGVRPYLGSRMPRFGESAAHALVADLVEACRPAQLQEIDVSGGKGHQRFATGRTLLGTGTGGLGCVACHGIKNREPAGMRAINLTHTAQRLQPEYFKALLLDPQGVQPGTIMPPLLAGRANADKEVESIWTYFKELDQSNVLPEGLALPGSFELKPERGGAPIVFRTFLEGAGTQAIAVGFPAQLHAAFDAYEVRWALVWRGRFLDAQSNWEERPMKPVKPLGDARRALPTHQPLARLRQPADPWPKEFGVAADYHFKGYRLGADGTPTFRYAVGDLEVEDTVRPAPDGASLRRTLTVRGGQRDDAAWYFRGLSTGNAPRALEWRDGIATLEETISF